MSTRHLWRLLSDAFGWTELGEIYYELCRWTEFWPTSRRAAGNALPHYRRGDDSGWDNATASGSERVVAGAGPATFLTL